MRVKSLVLLALWLFAMVPRTAGAQDDAARKAQAQQLEAQALEDFDAGRFPAALAKYQQAHALWPLPELAFMQGRCLEALGRLPEAVAAFEQVLNIHPEPGLRDHTVKKLAELRVRMKASRPPDRPRPPQPPPQPPSQPPLMTLRTAAKPDLSPWAWVTLGTGAAAMIVGGTLLGVSKKEWDRLDALSDEQPSVTSTTQRNAYQRQERARAEQIAGWVLLGAGTAAAAASVTLFVLQVRQRGPSAQTSSQHPVLQPQWLDSGAFGLTVSGGF